MKKNNKKNIEIAVVLMIVIGAFVYFYGKGLFSIAFTNCPNELPSTCGIPMPPITLTNLNENTGFNSGQLSSLSYVNNASAVYFAGSTENSTVYGYTLVQVVNQPNYYYSGAGKAGGSILINGNIYYEPTFNIVFPLNTSNKTDVQTALNYDINYYNNINSFSGLFNTYLYANLDTQYLNINLFNAVSSACLSNVTKTFISGIPYYSYNNCIAFNEVVPAPSSSALYTPISTGIEYKETISFLQALNTSLNQVTTTTPTTTTPTTTLNTTQTTTPTTVTPPPPPPQFNIGQLLNSILSAITGFLKTIGL